jgi:hypothetical protein
MPKASLASLAAGVASRLGQLTVQTAKQAGTRAEQLARKGLTDATKLLDQALDKTDTVETKEAKAVTRKTKTTKLPAPKAKHSTKR